ncbi:BTAD domain-containing putative transcriptional regulator [Actinoplanes sp. NPDC049596]|uniref:AfsR/SARP family transcriptional regulator n=1 Tax=unclassified Actinoplanes TaxID=2626549 RepID=UPI003422DE85
MIRLRVFGGLRLWRSGVEADVGPVRQRTVLAVLLAARGSTVSTAKLIDILWGDRPSASAVNQVQRLVGQIRRLFEPGLAHREPGEWLHPAGDGYRLRVDGRACDLMAFFELAADGRRAARDDDPRAAAQKFEQALSTAAEEPFAGLPPGLLALPAFVAIQSARTELAVEAADLALGHGRTDQLLPLISRYAAAAPLHEPLQARLIRLYTRGGRRAEALAHYEEVRHRLTEDLGADPGAELRAAHLDALADREMPDPYQPAQLPLPVAAYVPREELAPALNAGVRSGLIVLSGMAGAGKTALAVDWAHRIAGDYPDGQLHLNLRGFDPSGRQVRPFEALGTLLESIGVEPAAAGGDLDARAARFRSALAGRRMIVLLDNARDSAQVRPLLPGSADCLVVVTSRNRLPGLVAHEGAWPVHIGRMNRAAARSLLTRRLGTARLAAEPAAADQLIRLCAGLPLALSIAAAQIAVSPGLPMADAMAAMNSPAGRLDGLETGERQDGVRSAFSWSYTVLSEPAARLFRLLAVHPGPDFSVEAAASVAGADIRDALAELCVTSMITQLSAGWYTMHDLLYAYATELLDAADGERGPAELRLVEHYVHASHAAYLTFRLAPPAELGPPPPGVVTPGRADVAAAMAWYGAERSTVAAAVDIALQRGWARSAALIVLHLRPLRSIRLDETAAAREQSLRVLAAVEPLGDPRLETMVLRETALTVRVTDPERSRAFLHRALDLAERGHDRLGQAQVLRNLGNWPPLYPEAQRLDFLRRAVAAARAAGEPSVLAYALEALAKELVDQGDLAEAAGHAADAFAVAGAAGMSDSQVSIAVRRADIGVDARDYAAAAEMAEWALTHSVPDDNYTLLLGNYFLALAAAGLGQADRARAAAGVFTYALEQYGDAYRAAFGTATVAELRDRVAEALQVVGTASDIH